MNAKNALLNWDSQTQPISVETKISVSKRRKRTWLTFFRDILLYFTTYIVISGISIGPLFWVWFGAVYVDGPKWFARLYVPLAFLCEICPPIDWLVNSWIDWWILS